MRMYVIYIISIADSFFGSFSSLTTELLGDSFVQLSESKLAHGQDLIS